MSEKVERKPMVFADAMELRKTIFDTKVNISQYKAKETGKWFTVITLGKDQDKKFMVHARGDDKGTCLMTDYEEYQRAEQAKAKTTKV